MGKPLHVNHDGVAFELDFVIGKDFHKFKSTSSHISLFLGIIGTMI
jgi:hypothetical protein